MFDTLSASPGPSSTCEPRVGELEAIGPDPHFSCPQLASAALSTSSNGMVVFWLAPCTTARTSAQRDAVPVYRVRRRGKHKPLVGFSLGPRNAAVEQLSNVFATASQPPASGFECVSWLHRALLHDKQTAAACALSVGVGGEYDGMALASRLSPGWCWLR